MKQHVSVAVVVLGASMGVAIGACGSKQQSNVNNPPPSCPPGQVWNGQQCAPDTSATATTTAPPPNTTGTATAPPPPIPTAQPGPTATPLDATAASAVVKLLDPLAKQHAPAGATPTGGAALAGNFNQGQSLEVVIQMQPGVCYTVVGAAMPTVQNLDIQIAPQTPLPGMAAVLAQDQTTGPTAVTGAKPNCFKWAAPMAAPMRVILTVSAGQGMAAAQVYQK